MRTSNGLKKALSIFSIVALLVTGIVWALVHSWEKSLDSVDESLKKQFLPKPDKQMIEGSAAKPVRAEKKAEDQAVSHEAVNRKRPAAEESNSLWTEDDEVVHRITDPLQADLDSNNPTIVVEAVKKFMLHQNTAVRLKAVEALSGTGPEGFIELNKMLRDKDPEVARAALDAWSIAVQSIEYSDKKVANIKEVGDIAIQGDADAFQDVLEVMFDLPDSVVLPMLINYAGKTNNPDILDNIIDKFNFRAQPDEPITSVDGIAGAITEFNKRQAEEDAQEAGTQTATTLTTTSETN